MRVGDGEGRDTRSAGVWGKGFGLDEAHLRRGMPVAGVPYIRNMFGMRFDW